MTDVEIKLYDTHDDEPLTTMDGSYEDFARLETRSIVNRVVTAFEFHIDEETKYQMVLNDKHRQKLRKNWVPLNTDEDQIRHGLQLQVDDLIREWRADNNAV